MWEVRNIDIECEYKYLAAGGDAKPPGAYQRSEACDQRPDSLLL